MGLQTARGWPLLLLILPRGDAPSLIDVHYVARPYETGKISTGLERNYNAQDIPTTHYCLNKEHHKAPDSKKNLSQ
ncbi:MAG: hypothetical protein ACI9PN_002615 [Candidatus Azotimanducaceae bacterium]|jgi:hypothetical protein